MPTAKWLVFALGAGAAAVYAAWWYGSREDPLAGRGWAAALRAAALSLAWLLLLNPSLPGTWDRGALTSVALLDASLSMARLRGADQTSLWMVAADSALRYDRVWLFGGSLPLIASRDSLPAHPFATESRLAPAIRAAAAAGARQAVVLTDGRLSDPGEAASEARRQGVALTLRVLEATVAEYGIAELSAPTWVQAGDTVEVQIEVVASAEAESATLEILDAGERVLASRQIPLPDVGRFTSLRLAFSAPQSPGHHRLRARLVAERPDAEVRDNERAFYLRVTDRPRGPLLISLSPDWESSYLLAHLDRLSDEPATAFLWISDSLLVSDKYRRVSTAAALSGARAAPLAVIHGYSIDAPSWAREAVRDARNLLLLPAGVRAFDLPGWGVRIGEPLLGEWYPSDDIPPSELALDLSGLAVEDLPPLLRVRSIDGTAGSAPLALQRARRGEPAAALVMGRAGSRRWAVATADGYWRWALRPAAGRQLYRALWTGVAGWLMGSRTVGVGEMDPVRRVVQRDERLVWQVPADVDSLTVELSTLEGAPGRRAAARAGDSLSVLPQPGVYRYRARVYREGSVAGVSEGPVEVEEFASELLPRLTSSAESLQVEVREPAGDANGTRRPLASLGWPYLVLIALFCGEWVVRRRIGLR